MKKILLLLTISSFAVSVYSQTDDELYQQAFNYCSAYEFDKAIPILRELDTKNHALSLALIGELYENGDGYNKDIRKADV